MIYLDNCATTQLDPFVREAMERYADIEYGNPSSIYAIGRSARIALEDAREMVATAIGADPAEIVFTSGGTESNNHAIKGTLFAASKSGKTFNDLLIVTSGAEHHAVLEPVSFFESFGTTVHRIAPDEFGIIHPSAIRQKNISFASFMLVNNEVGSINPLKELAEGIRTTSPDAIVHSDAVQALGKIDINVRDLGVDLLSLSAHKIHGPKGIGALYIRRGIKLEPLHHGGAQERNRRGGTEPVALAVGFAEAIKQMQLQSEHRKQHIRQLHQYAIKKLSDIPEIIFNSARDEKGVDGIFNISFIPKVLSRIDGEALLIRFDLEGIALSNGSACTSGSIQPSHVLLAMGKGNEIASKSLRISFSRFTTTQEIDTFISTLETIIR